VNNELQIEYEYTVTRVAGNAIYGDKVSGAKSVAVGGSVDIDTEIGRVRVEVSDGGFVAVKSDMLTRLMVYDGLSKSGTLPPRELEVVDMATGGKGLRVMLRDGDELWLAPNTNGLPKEGATERLKVKYTSNGVKLCNGWLHCTTVKEGQKVVLGRGDLGMRSEYVSGKHVEVEVRREYVNGEYRLVAWVRDVGSANGTVVHGQDGDYVIYAGRASDRAPVAGIPPQGYGIRTPHEVRAYVGNIGLKLPHAAPPAARPATAIRV